MTSIFIATPCYGGQCTSHFTQSLLQTVGSFSRRNWNMAWCQTMNESLIQRARNALVFNFLKRDDMTHLMFIDADISFNGDDIVAMVDADKDIICGLYPKKEINWPSVTRAVQAGVPDQQLRNYTGSFVVNLEEGVSSVTLPITEPFKIQNGGTGFMLIKKQVFLDLQDKLPWYINDVTDLSGNLNADKITEFFPVFIEESSKRLLSEDYAFCTIARQHGYDIWGAPWARLSHIGTYIFDGKPVPAP